MPWRYDPVLQAGGECGTLMRALDWTRNPLGPPAGWSPELRTVVGIALGSNQPMFIVWGPEQTTLYNDGYAVICGQRHPAAFGGSFRDLWYDIWDAVDPIITAAYDGISTSMDDIAFVMHRNGFPEETHFSFSYTPVRSPAGEVLGMFCACTEITEEVMRRREEERERERWQALFEMALGATAILTGPDHVFTFVNDDYRAMVGRSDLVGRPIAEALPEVVDQGFSALLDHVYRTGRAHVGRGVPFEFRRTPEGPLEQRIIDFTYQPLANRAGRVQDIFVQALDVTEQHVLHRELGHRLKNQLSIVQAIVGQTLRTAPDVATAREAVEGRIAVLARANETLLAGETRSSAIIDVVRDAISLQYDEREGRFLLDGPGVHIAARPAFSLSLIVHELLTNAIKYGALSRPEGRVRIEWQVVDTPEGATLDFVWREEGGPAPGDPGRVGTGTRLIRSGLAGGARSHVTIAYEPTGLVCSLRADLASVQEAG